MRRVTRAAVAVLGALVVLGAVLAPASGAPARLGLSWDGTTWSPTLAGTLFGRSGAPVTWVPGDVDTRTFYVRNQSTDDATVAVQYLLPADRLPTTGNLELAVRVGTGPWRSLAPATAWAHLEIAPLDAGSSTSVSVRGTFDWASPNTSQGQLAPVDFHVQLAGVQADVAAGGEGHGGHGAGDGGPDGAAAGSGLAATGAPELGWLAGTSLVCLMGGLLLVVVFARRREQRDGQAS